MKVQEKKIMHLGMGGKEVTSLREKLHYRMQLTHDDRFGLASLMLLQGLADTEHRRKPVGTCSGELARNQLIAFCVIQATLGMSDQRPSRADIGEHGGRYLAGEGALSPVLADILSTKTQPGASMLRSHRREVGNGWKYRYINVFRLGGSNLAEQRSSHRTAAVHFPVAGDEFLAHGQLPPLSNPKLTDGWGRRQTTRPRTPLSCARACT